MNIFELLKGLTKILSIITFLLSMYCANQEKWDKATFYMTFAIYLWI